MDGGDHFVGIGIVAQNYGITENSFSDALGSSVLEIQIWAHHRMSQDDYIGGSKETIESLLKQEPTGSSRLETLLIIY